jgi:hypothetical protein
LQVFVAFLTAPSRLEIAVGDRTFQKDAGAGPAVLTVPAGVPHHARRRRGRADESPFRHPAGRRRPESVLLQRIQ